MGVLTATLLRPVPMSEPLVPEVLPRVPERHRRVVKESPHPEPPPVLVSRDTELPMLREQPLPAPAPSAPVAPLPMKEVNIVPAAPPTATARVGEAQAAPVPRFSPGVAALANSPDAGNVEEYRLALISAAKRYKRYPGQAVENGWTGKVEVRLVINAEGGVERTLVKSSSGYDVLDSQALDMMRKAESLTPVPAALRGHGFSVDIPVVFDLQTG